MQMKRVDSTNKTREREGGVKFKVSNQSKAVFPLFTFDEKNLHLMDGYACVNEHKEGAVHINTQQNSNLKMFHFNASFS